MNKNKIFEKIKIKNTEFSNRIVVSPMCQYSAKNGLMNDWHFQHLSQFGFSGAGLVMIESTAVENIGRITHNCTGIYDEDCLSSIKTIMEKVKALSLNKVKFGIQLGHAGRKASTQRPWEGRSYLRHNENPWKTIAPSAIPFDKDWPIPQEMNEDDLQRAKMAFIDATRRSVKAGFDLIEIHAAHGYLLHQFISPLSNQRKDKYGGSLDNRMRFPLEVFEEVVKVSNNLPIGMRITGTEWEENGIEIEDALVFSKQLKNLGCDYVCVSSGGNTPSPKIPVKEHYQVHLSKHIKQNSDILTRTVGMITDPIKANKILENDESDMIAMARAFLSNPRWVWDAADILGAEIETPNQYARRFKKSI